MKKVILFGCILISAHVFSQQIAYVNSDSILLSLNEYGRKTLKLDSLKKTYQNELEESKSMLQKRYDKLMKPYNPDKNEQLESIKMRMNPLDTISLSMLMEENALLLKKSNSYNNIIKSIYDRDIQPELNLVKQIISEYAVNNNLIFIYNIEQLAPSLVFCDPKRNVTKSIIEMIKMRK
jgi:Skp family chaperone for outer membrane proteins